ncbi:DUF6069 family protein [Actinocorallia sp. API 0066]|nr:DUF6069 family protein [Actinocorallia sp. API 0066]
MATAVAAVLTWVVGDPVLGHDLVVTAPNQDPQDLGAAEILFITVASSLLGWAALAVLEKLLPRYARVTWTALALIVLLLSYVPFLNVEATTGSKVVLGLAHVVVAAVLIPLFLRTTKPVAAEAAA